MSSIDEYNKKNMEYERVKRVSKIGILMSMPIEFGICDNGKKVYSLFSWIDGEDAENALPNFNKSEQYKLGIQSGRILKKIHSIVELVNQEPWEEYDRYIFTWRVSIPFAIGYIHGYFDNNVPDEFFRLMSLYNAANIIASIPWAIPFGEVDINNMLTKCR